VLDWTAPAGRAAAAVEDDHLVARLEQPLNHPDPEEACSSHDKRAHG
jgi:hypothetical protein